MRLMSRAPYSDADFFDAYQRVTTEMLRYEDEYEVQKNHGIMETLQVQGLEEQIAQLDAHVQAWYRYSDDVEDSWRTWHEQRSQTEKSAGDLRDELFEENYINQQLQEQCQELYDTEANISAVIPEQQSVIATLMLQNDELEDEVAEAKKLLTASSVSQEEIQEVAHYPLLQEIIKQKLETEQLMEDLRTLEFEMKNDCKSHVESPVEEEREMVTRMVRPRGTVLEAMESVKRTKFY